MQPSNIQAMIAINAARITEMGIQIGYLIDQAKFFKQTGEPAFCIDAYKKADHKRSKLAKAVSLQRSMKAELDAYYRFDRIIAKSSTLTKAGVFIVSDIDDTDYEVEAKLDAAMLLTFPPKADSRKV